MLDQRHRRWANIKQTLLDCVDTRVLVHDEVSIVYTSVHKPSLYLSLSLSFCGIGDP